MTIPEIKARLPLSHILSRYGWSPDARGRMRCPFHDDATPSMQVYPATGTAYCFAGGCRTHGRSLDVIDLVMEADGCTKHEAIVRCKSMAGALPAAGAPKPLPSKSEEGDRLAREAVLAKAWGVMRSGVAVSKPARAYLAGRGLDHKALEAAGAGVGYNSGQLHHRGRHSAAFVASCVRWGLLSETGHKSRTGQPALKTFAKGSVAFALRTEGGQVGGLYFRSLRDDGARHFYLRDRRGLWPGWPASETRRVLLTESVIDAAGVVQHAGEVLPGAESWAVLSLYGTNGFTAEHTAALARLGGLEEVTLMLDADAAGRAATEVLAAKVRKAWPGVRVTAVDLPEGADANGVLVDGGPGALARAVARRRGIEVATASAGAVEVPALPPDETSDAEAAAMAELPTVKVTGEVAAAVREAKDWLSRLDESGPYDLGYRGRASRGGVVNGPVAEYRVKGFRVGQADSLKVTLHIGLGGGAPDDGEAPQTPAR